MMTYHLVMVQMIHHLVFVHGLIQQMQQVSGFLKKVFMLIILMNGMFFVQVAISLVFNFLMKVQVLFHIEEWQQIFLKVNGVM